MLASMIRTFERPCRVRASAFTAAGSISTPTTARARSASSIVNAPSLAPTALRRKEGRIRLHQHVVQRDDTGRPDDAVGGGIGDGRRERDVEAAGQRLCREGGVPAKAMEDAVGAREFVEDCQQIREGV